MGHLGRVLDAPDPEGLAEFLTQAADLAGRAVARGHRL